jgi:hypothetical protein
MYLLTNATEQNKMSAAEKIQKIIDTIESGKTVYVCTAYRHTKITPKTLNNWKKSGFELLKASGKNMLMAQGKKYVCIDYCKITVEG